MARGINKVTLIGFLGKDPEVRYLQNGDMITTLSVATSESWKDKTTGETKERTEWHRVVIYGKLAEIANEYAKKGAQIYIDGQLRTRKWTDSTGMDRYTTQVEVASNSGNFQLLGTNIPKEDSNTQQATPSYKYKNSASNNKNQTPTPTASYTENPPIDFDDDIPF